MTPWRPILLWFVIAAVLAVYLVMVVWSLPKIAAMADGLPAFDMRPLGYTLAEARSFLAALSPEGRAFYTGVQHRLDLVFPGLLALMFLFLFRRLAPGWPGQALSLIALAGAAFDWAENAAVAGLLAREPTDETLVLASRLTLLKSACTTLAMTTLLILLARAGLRRWRRTTG